MKWSAGELFDPELWILSDSPDPLPAGRVEAWLNLGDEKIFLLEWRYPDLQPATNLKGPKIQFTFPFTPARRFQLALIAPENAKMDSVYTLLIS
jgi:beta-mannosidase